MSGREKPRSLGIYAKASEDLKAGRAVSSTTLDLGLLEFLLESGVDYTGDAAPLRRHFGSGLSSASDADLQRAAALVKIVAFAMSFNKPPFWKSISDAYELISGTTGLTAKRRRAVGILDHCLTDYRGGDPQRIAPLLIRQLCLLDDRFAKLNPKRVAAMLPHVRPMAERSSGGPGRIGPPLALARLCVMVGAFGDTDVPRSKKDFLAAIAAPRRVKGATGK